MQYLILHIQHYSKYLIIKVFNLQPTFYQNIIPKTYFIWFRVFGYLGKFLGMIPKNSVSQKVFGYAFGYGFGYDFQKHNLLIFNKTFYILNILFCFFNLKKI